MRLTDNLYGYWKLDETGVRLDSSGQSHDLSDPNNVPIASGKINNGANLSYAFPVGQCFTRTHEPQQFFSSSFSVSMWLKPSILSSFGGLFSKTGTGQFCLTANYINNELQIGFATDLVGAGWQNGVMPNLFTGVGSWEHIVIVYDGSLTGNSNRLKIYKNKINQALSFVGNIPAIVTNSNAPLQIGRSGTNLGFSGVMDEVGWWSRPLSSSEVIRLNYEGRGLPFDVFDAGTQIVKNVRGYSSSSGIRVRGRRG